jgi:hypothetical protein
VDCRHALKRATPSGCSKINRNNWSFNGKLANASGVNTSGLGMGFVDIIGKTPEQLKKRKMLIKSLAQKKLEIVLFAW